MIDNISTPAEDIPYPTLADVPMHYPPSYIGGWGDKPVPIDEFTTLRIVYQNVNGLNASDPGTQFLLHKLQAIQCGIFCASETNVNWRNRSQVSKFKALGDKVWTSHRLIVAAHSIGSTEAAKNKSYLPGGVAIWVNQFWSTRVVECGQDEHNLGRWCWVTLGIPGGTYVTIVCVYRVCKQNVRTAGALTATRQQFDSLELQRGKTTSTKLVNPRAQTPHDLQLFFKIKQAAGHLLIVANDVNETLAEAVYPDGTVRKGTMEETFRNCSLHDIFTQPGFELPPTSTSIEGRYIDRIVSSPGIHVSAAGILPIFATKVSDHSPFFLDINGEQLLGGKISPLAKLAVRRLSVKNEQSVAKYLDYAFYQVEYHNLDALIKTLTKQFYDNGAVLSPSMKNSLFAIDKQYLEIVLAAARQCSKKGSHATDWSPEYKRAGCLVSYWKYRLALKSPTSDKVSRKLGKKAGLDIWEIDRCILRPEVKSSLAEATAWFNCIKRDAWQYRVHFQEAQAAIAAHGNDTVKQRILSQIQASEKSTRSFRRIATALGKSRTGLTKLIVTDPDGTETVLVDKDAIHAKLLARNERHYGQANETVFGADNPNAYLLDPSNPDNIADKLLDGNAGFDIQHLSQESREWLGCLVRSTQTEISMDITEEDYISHYKCMPEKKSSSPSGKDVSHYIVAARAKNPLLRNLVIQIAHLALIAATPLPRWNDCLLTMLEKGKGPYIEKLRIIQIAESDFNFVLGLLWGKRLSRKCVAEKLLEPTQFATRGQLCNSAALTTNLFFDIHRQTHEPAAVTMLDAVACFDRHLHSLSIPVTMKYGVPRPAAEFLYNALRQLTFRVNTAHGVSDSSFSVLSNPARPLQGLGQGLGEAAGVHILVQDVSNKPLTLFHPKALLRHPCPESPAVTQQKSLFMDDTTLYANLAGLTSHMMKAHGWIFDTAVAQAMKHLVKTYSGYLWTTGGRLALEKCYWYLLKFTRQKNGLYKLLSVKNSRFDMSLQEEDLNGRLVTIPQLEPSDARRGLGVVVAPDGNSLGQRSVLLGRAVAWANSIRASNLNAADIWRAYTAVLWPGLVYPLAASSLSINDLKIVQQKVSKIIRNSLHVNKSFPDALFYGAKRYGGLGIIPLIVQQCILKLLLFIRHVRTDDDINKQLQISIGYTQLEVGQPTQFFRLLFSTYRHLLTNTWTTHLWEFLSVANLQLWHASTVLVWTPKLQRVNDSFLADHIIHSSFTHDEQRLLNEWRMYLHLITVADIVGGNGFTLSPDIYFGWHSSERSSKLNWPAATRLHTSNLPVWQRFLDSISNGMRLLQPLGEWLSPASSHNKWNYRVDPMGGLWRRDSTNSTYAELQPYTFRTIPRRGRFFPTTYVVPVDLVGDDAIATWNFADIVECGHYSRPPLHLSVPSVFAPPCHVESGVTIQPCLAVTTAFDTFTFSMDTMEPVVRRLIGDLCGPTLHSDIDFIATEFEAGNLLCVSDGSFNPQLGRGSHAWVMTTVDEATLFRGVGPVDGDPATMSSYRPELHGILAILTLLNTIATAYPIPTNAPVLLVCDNEGATTEITKIVTLPHYKLDPNQTDCDLLLEIQWAVHRSPAAFTVQWIKGHQEDHVAYADLCLLSRLNIDCDTRAKAFLRQSQFVPLPPPTILPHERWGLVAAGHKVTTNLPVTIYESYTAPISKKYLATKFGWSPVIIKQVAWNSLHFAKRSLSMPRNVFVSKIMFDKLPVADRLHFFDSAESPICRCCNVQTETQHHLFQCKEKLCKSHRLVAWIRHTRAILISGHTSRIIMDAIDGNLRKYLRLPQRPTKWQSSQGHRSVFAAVQRAIADQSKIGWDKLLYGFVSTRWETAQRLYQEITGDYPPHPPRSWTESFLVHLWEFSHDVWVYRNEIKHGVTKIEQATISRARVVALVTDRFRHRPHLDGKYSWLYKKPLSTLLLQGNRALYVWLNSVNNLSSISSGPIQSTLFAHTLFQRLSDEAINRLRRPKGRLRRLFPIVPIKGRPKLRKFALGQPSLTSPRTLPLLWGFSTPLVPVPKPDRPKKQFKKSVRSHDIRKMWDRGRKRRILT